MKAVATITENDFGRETHSEKWQTYRVREAARAILLDDQSRIALMHVASDNYYKLPGGGIDEGEDVATALKRELLEEVGASAIELLAEVGQVDEYRDEYEVNGRHYCFVAKLAGSIVEPARTEKELAEGYETVWATDIDEAIRLVERGTPKDYGHNFERLRELAFLNEAKPLLFDTIKQINYRIKQPTVIDALNLTKLHNQSWIETYPNDEYGITKSYIEERVANRLSEEGVKRREAAIQQSYDDPTYFLRIAKNEADEIVGFIDGHLKEGEYWLDGLYTLKSTYGTGLGKLLWDTYLPWTNNEDILLTVATYNDRARAFYSKLGFEDITGTERNFADTPIPVIDMIRKAKNAKTNPL